jgi:hypothetical protein
LNLTNLTLTEILTETEAKLAKILTLTETLTLTLT